MATDLDIFYHCFSRTELLEETLVRTKCSRGPLIYSTILTIPLVFQRIPTHLPGRHFDPSDILGSPLTISLISNALATRTFAAT